MQWKSWRTVWMVLAVVGIITVAIAWNEIVYNVKLINAARLGQQYYESYPHIAKDIPYADQAHQVLDVYSPETPGDYPVIIYIHGGGWDSGNKELYALVAKKLVPYGVVVVVPKYALYPDATYPQMVADVGAVVAWTHANIANYGGNPARIGLGGQSAGAQLSAMALLDASVLAAYQLDTSAVCAYYGISGVYDINDQYAFEQSFGRTAPVMTAVMGGQAQFTATSPVTYVRPDVPPLLIVHGDADETVPLRSSEQFVSALQQASAPVELIVYPDRGHSELLFYTITQEPGQMIVDMVDFVTRSCPATAS